MYCVKDEHLVETMGIRKDKTGEYESLSPEELHSHIRKNVSIPKYMDAFLYENDISLSKLVQNAIIERMKEEQEIYLKKDVEKQMKEKNIRQHIKEKQKENPQFNHDLLRAKQVLLDYFTAFDSEDKSIVDQQKQYMFNDFPEMYVDVVKFEKWKQQNTSLYQTMRQTYENPVERLVKIKKQFF
jgi:hypothetical protein